MRTGFIGAGKVGFSLGRFLRDGGVHVTGYYSRHVESAKEAAEFTRTECFESLEEIVKQNDALFLTVPDGEISNVYEEIAKFDISGKLICHTSGALAAREAFPGIAQKGAYGYSVHPLFPVHDKRESYKELAGAFFCIEGTGADTEYWRDILEKCGAKAEIISADAKTIYHAGCVMASNLVCGIVSEAVKMLEKSGFSEENAKKALMPLILSNVSHINDLGPEGALTGPIERNDVGTVKKHLEAIDDGLQKSIYVELSKSVTKLALRKHPERNYSEMEDVLNGKR